MKIIILIFTLALLNSCASSKPSGVVQVTTDMDTTIHDYPDQQALFPGGVDEFLKYIKLNVSQSKVFQNATESSRFIATFIVEIDGSISNISFMKTNGNKTEEQEVIKILQRMPKWTPAYHRGKIVRSNNAVPVNNLPKG